MESKIFIKMDVSGFNPTDLQNELLLKHELIQYISTHKVKLGATHGTNILKGGKGADKKEIETNILMINLEIKEHE